MIIINGIVLITIEYYNKEITIKHIIITLLTEIIYCLELVLCKCAVNTKYSSPYLVCFYTGILEIILFSILLIIFSNIKLLGTENMNYLNDEYIDNFSIYIEKVDANEVLIFILNMFGRLIVILFSFITLDYFTPLHSVLVLIIGEISFLFNDEYDWKIFLKIFFFIFLIFFILVFLEIIELNILGLQKNTQNSISQRSCNEEMDINKRNYNFVGVNLLTYKEVGDSFLSEDETSEFN